IRSIAFDRTNTSTTTRLVHGLRHGPDESTEDRVDRLGRREDRRDIGVQGDDEPLTRDPAREPMGPSLTVVEVVLVRVHKPETFGQGRAGSGDPRPTAFAGQ